MPLPNLIEIVPLTEPVHAEITVPGSKSITNRALVLAALADGEVTLKGALWSEDTQVMVECLQELGFMVNVAPDPAETCNRTITVYGQGGKVPRGGTIEQPMELFVGNAGTAARFLAAMVCLGEGVYRLHGVPRMHERPQAALFQALRELGYRIDSPNDKLPALVFGGGSERGSIEPQHLGVSGAAAGHRPALPRSCRVSIAESSQFASALLLAGRVGKWRIEITGENAEESPYVRMTSELIKVFPHQGGEFQIEPDASSGSYFLAADWIQWVSFRQKMGSEIGMDWVKVKQWPDSVWQIDTRYRELRTLQKEVLSRKSDIADSIMIAIAKAPLNPSPVTSQILVPKPVSEPAGISGPPPARVFKDLGRLRVQETERVKALKSELEKCGAKVIEEGDTLTVFPSQLHGAEIETYNDHRMAMCFGVLGLKVPGMKIRKPACVKKTFPNFWQKLAAAPPHGLGASILDARTGRKLSHEELFAD
jgi:3-phosphoshikimate 1-carboxyvinyltransferase